MQVETLSLNPSSHPTLHDILSQGPDTLSSSWKMIYIARQLPGCPLLFLYAPEMQSHLKVRLYGTQPTE